MIDITRDGRTKIDDYYIANPAQVPPCEPSYDPKWYRLTPYDCKETINWALKMLVLPGAIAILIIIYVTFDLYDNPILQYTSSVLTIISTFLLWIYLREQSLGAIHYIHRRKRLPEGLTPRLNPIQSTKLTIGFVGDIMMMRDHDLEFDQAVEQFFDRVDLIVCNLEGIIPEQENKYARQSHKEVILDQLRPLLKNQAKWLVCVSNNHSIDFGNTKFIDSIKTIQKPTKPINNDKFKAFGRNDVPKLFLNDKVCISSATKWSNQKKWTCTSEFDNNKLNGYYCTDKFNILYPHWGYENERYTRRRIQKKAKKLLTVKKWDLIFGHHPHTRQPVMKVEDGSLKKLVFFSGGNFTSGVTFWRKKKHIHGIIMKCQIGPLNGGRYAVGDVEWRKTFNEEVPNRPRKTKIIKFGEGIAGRSRLYIVVIAIVTVFLMLLPRILEFFGW